MSISHSQAPSSITTSDLQVHHGFGDNPESKAIDFEFDEFSVHLIIMNGKILNLSLWENTSETIIGSYPHELVQTRVPSDQLDFDWNQQTVH